MIETGATIVAVKASDGVVLCGDRKVTLGSLVLSRGAKKIHMATESVAVGFSGMIADAQTILKLVREEVRYYKLITKRELSTEAIAKLLSNILYSQKLFPMSSEVIVAGVDERRPQIIVLDSLGSTLVDEYAAVGTGAPIAYGVLEEGYRQDMKIDEARVLAINAIKSALKRDALSGGAIDVIVIKSDGEVREEVIEERI